MSKGRKQISKGKQTNRFIVSIFWIFQKQQISEGAGLFTPTQKGFGYFKNKKIIRGNSHIDVNLTRTINTKVARCLLR